MVTLSKVKVNVKTVKKTDAKNPTKFTKYSELADTCSEVITESKQFSTQMGQFRDTTKSLIQSMEEVST